MKSNSASKGGSDSKFFTTTKKGENHELRQELTSQNANKKKDAVKKVIANMTVGKDVSMLFTDVVNCMQTGNIELKKLVYLYLINYAKSNPDLAILAVNTFVKDANDPNPLIRALAVRTMGCIRVERITEYLCEPLRRCLRDEDPYVRKTAAICVAKLYDISPEMVEDQGFLDSMRDLICDSNPTVVANAVAGLTEIAQNNEGREVFVVTTAVLQKLLAALNECTEWGQVFILDALARYTPTDAREAEGIIERVTPRLQHANSAVVMSAVKVIMGYLEQVTNADTLRALSRKLAPPLVTLLSTEPEIQYVALRNINLIVQKRPNILSHEIKVFFCKYNDPIYVKMEKLEIIIRLVSDRNIEQVLLEFKEYATEVDVDFVRKAVRAIGRCAIKLERAAERCINVLLELIQTKVNYVVQEAVIVIKDIFRKYPNRYESIIATLCENLDTLDEPEAKGSMIWIIGEYAERIDNADELLETFLDSFHDETGAVQLQLLTSTVKLFLKRPADTQDMVQSVLKMATEDSDNPDLRDRGYVYWRLLSTNPDAAKAVVLAEKPVIADDTAALDPALLNNLISNIASLGSIYHKPTSAFVVKSTKTADEDDDSDSDSDDDEGAEDSSSYGGNAGGGGGGAAPAPAPQAAAAAAPVDLLDMMSMGDSPAPAPAPAGGGGGDLLDDMFGGGGGGAPAAAAPVQHPVLLTADKGGGASMRGAVVRDPSGQIFYEMAFTNEGCSAPLTGVAIQLNKSSFGLSPTAAQQQLNPPLQTGQSGSIRVPLACNPAFVAPGPPTMALQAAMKNMATNHVSYFVCNVDFSAIFVEGGALEKGQFIGMWKQIDDQKEVYATVMDLPSADIDVITGKLATRNVFYIARRRLENGQEVAYYSIKTATNVQILLELTFKAGLNGCKVCVKTEQPALAPLTQALVESVIKA
jgi:AP-1 complex subunit beta-1